MTRHKVVVATAAALTALGIGAGVVLGTGVAGMEDESEVPITGPALQKAEAAALAATGGGRVTGTEIGDEESLYEVEVTMPDGTEVDVQLDGRFSVIGEDAGPEESGDTPD